MENLKLSTYVKLGGIVVGVISAITLISQHPIHIITLTIGAGVYFIGEYLEKRGD